MGKREDSDVDADSPQRAYVVAVLGMNGSGKTSLVFRLTQEHFLADSSLTIDEYDSFRKSLLVDEARIELEIHDTLDRFICYLASLVYKQSEPLLSELAMRRCNGAVFCFSMASREGFEQIRPLRCFITI